MKVLVGYDGSECSDSAIDSLVKAGLPEQGEASIWTVADVWPGALDTGIETVQEGDLVRIQQMTPQEMEKLPPLLKRAYAQAQAEMDNARGAAVRGAERFRRLFPGWQVESRVEAASPTWGLVHQAGAWKADLMVLGSHGRTGLTRFFIGSVSQFAVTHAPCSVHIGRCRPPQETPAGDARPPVRIAIGVDGSEDSEQAVREVMGRRWPEGTQVRVIAALDPRLLTMPLAAGYPSWGLGGEIIGEERHWYENMVHQAADELRAAGLDAVPVVRDGDPKWALVEEAESWGADTLFVGARGHGMMERLLVGSVSTAVATRAHCSVEIIRPAT